MNDAVPSQFISSRDGSVQMFTTWVQGAPGLNMVPCQAAVVMLGPPPSLTHQTLDAMSDFGRHQS